MKEPDLHFNEEFEADRARRLRRRFLWYSGILGGLGLARIALILVMMAQGIAGKEDALGAPTDARMLLITIASTLIHLGACFAVWRRPFERRSLVHLLLWVVFLSSAIGIIFAPAIARERFERGDVQLANMTETKLAVAAMLASVVALGFNHLLACLFIPLSPREAVRPLVRAAGLTGLVSALTIAAPVQIHLFVAFAAIVMGAPGMLWSWWRHSRSRERFGHSMLRGRYGEMSRELSDARRVHEALFPPPLERGSVRLAYSYEPMREIGGDFLFAHPLLPAPAEQRGPTSVAIIDVTGHGVPAALSVNRLHDLLERAYRERPATTPGEALAALNEFVFASLARQRVFATAVCLRIDPDRGALEWASAGHPPALLVRANGAIEPLDSTAIVLGVLPGPEFDPDQQSRPIAVGDRVVLYTDGATEARSRKGAMLRIEGVREAVRAAAAAGIPLAQGLLNTVVQHRSGPPDDDCLVVEVGVSAE